MAISIEELGDHLKKYDKRIIFLGDGVPVFRARLTDEILAEEKELADSANAKREEEERKRAEQEAYWAEYRVKREAWEAEDPILKFH